MQLIKDMKLLIPVTMFSINQLSVFVWQHSKEKMEIIPINECIIIKILFMSFCIVGQKLYIQKQNLKYHQSLEFKIKIYYIGKGNTKKLSFSFSKFL